MKNKKTIITWLTIVLIAVVSFFLYQKKDKDIIQQQFVLRIPDAKFMGLLPLYVADEKGFFRENNIQIEWVDVKDPGQAEKAFLAGHADLNGTTFANLLQAEIRKPGTLSLFIPTYESSDKPGSYFLVRDDSPIKDLSNLKGEIVGTYSGPSQKAYAQIALRSLGLEIDIDYTLQQVGSSSQIQSLFGGTYNVLFTVEPYGSVAIQKGARKLDDGIRTKYIQNPFWVGAFEVKREFAKDSLKMNQIKSAMERAIKFINTTETEARQILAERTGIEKDVADKCYLYNWITTPSEKDIEEMQQLIKILVAEKLLEKEIDINTILYKNQ